jgi:putative SOS response-associated peptidase YedK
VCGRFAYFVPTAQLLGEFQLREAPEFAPRYNVAPTQDVVAIRQTADGDRQAAALRWGLVPHWAKDLAIGNRMINARGETVAEKPAFRQAFKRRRCILPVSGFYEWGPSAAGKWPYFISAKDAPLLSFAGLWESWRGGADADPVESCTIVTIAAAPSIAQVHERMPLCLPSSAYARWLGPATPAEECIELLTPSDAIEFAVRPVSRAVNSPRNDTPRLIDEVEIPAR